jgi:hypothetical protein
MAKHKFKKLVYFEVPAILGRSAGLYYITRSWLAARGEFQCTKRSSVSLRKGS